MAYPAIGAQVLRLRGGEFDRRQGGSRGRETVSAFRFNPAEWSGIGLAHSCNLLFEMSLEDLPANVKLLVVELHGVCTWELGRRLAKDFPGSTVAKGYKVS